MWELDHKESWVPKNWCFWTVVLENSPIPESPLDYKEVKQVNHKWNQSWIFIGRTDAKAETPILWPLDTKNWLTGKDPDAGKDWRQEENGLTQDEMVGWHHWLDGPEFEQGQGVGDGQGSLACYNPWGCKESDTTEWLNWTETAILNLDNLKDFFNWQSNFNWNPIWELIILISHWQLMLVKPILLFLWTRINSVRTRMENKQINTEHVYLCIYEWVIIYKNPWTKNMNHSLP